MTRPESISRRGFLAGAATGSASVALASCSSAEPAPATSTTATPTASSPAPTTSPSARSWAPRPQRSGALTGVASRDGDRLALHTVGGDVRFWGGVNLGTQLPGHASTALAARADDYRRWFPMMAELGVRVVRLRTIHPPALYAELRSYNLAHPTAPLYLVQGVALPGDAVAKGRTQLFAPATTKAMSAELRDASAAVHGTLRRGRARGAAPTIAAARASGTWTADVSPWTAAWVVGDAWDPTLVQRTDTAGTKVAAHRGTYFSSARGAAPTERWLAARLDELAALEAAAGSFAPIGFANTPRTDPLAHPQEPDPRSDLASLDAGNVVASTAWPGGTFAAYDAMPYSPKFLFFQPDLHKGDDAYRAYLQQLRERHQGLPVMITSFAVASALGSGAKGVADRHQGNHSEQEAMRLDAEMLTMFADVGLAGGFLAAWHDDWAATTWNTAPRQALIAPVRRPLTHDPLTADQWLGLVSHDAVRSGERVVHSAPQNGLKQITFDHDASWGYLTLSFDGRVTSPVEIGFDIVPEAGLPLPGGSGSPVHDVAIRMVPTMSTALMFIRSAIDPARLDGLAPGWWPIPEKGGWNTQSLTLTDTYLVPGTTNQVSASFLPVGNLVLGSWDPDSPQYNSLATWHLGRTAPGGPVLLRFRMPLTMLAMADASARTTLVPEGFRAAVHNIKAMRVTVESSTPGSPITFPLTWPVWNAAAHTERVKAGAEAVRDALTATSRH